MREELKNRMKQTDALLNEVKDFIRLGGLDYDLEEWVTIKSYCEKFEIDNTQVISNWIKRGIVPPENVKEIEELNGLKLIKAVPYK
jgi:hypothetical protein